MTDASSWLKHRNAMKISFLLHQHNDAFTSYDDSEPKFSKMTNLPLLGSMRRTKRSILASVEWGGGRKALGVARKHRACVVQIIPKTLKFLVG